MPGVETKKTAEENVILSVFRKRATVLYYMCF